MKHFFAASVSSVFLFLTATGHTPQPAAGPFDDPAPPPPAYKVLADRKMVVEAELEEVSKIFASRHPDVESKNFELSAISDEMELVSAAEEPVSSKLTKAYGKLILRRVKLKVELRELARAFAPTHPDVKAKKAELDSLEHEIEAFLC